ncbi:hypothetical protein PRZ48_011006 [Zasmidium cellare]|uniref:Uncharacterized protein n=1 Tax=Zasmidium cellare TaxID=395010 RepID=A0ABR0EA82_ZASCE|nr:hypothetical protein PRZ48_011006 [Zasmidium cellare]
MNFSPYQWRAGEGYLPPPGSYPMPVCPQPYVAPFGYYPPGPFAAYPAGPAIAVPPPRPATAPASAPPKPPTPPEKKKEDRKPSSDDAKTCIHSLAPSAPLTLRPGVNYMHAPSHTKLHIFNKAAAVWEDKYKTETLAFKIFKVSTQFTVREVIERVIKGKPKDDVKWAVTEVVERGGGEWGKGSTIEYGSDKAKGTLEAMGWNERKGGGEIPPVWLVVHKV